MASLYNTWSTSCNNTKETARLQFQHMHLIYHYPVLLTQSEGRPQCHGPGPGRAKWAQCAECHRVDWPQCDGYQHQSSTGYVPPSLQPDLWGFPGLCLSTPAIEDRCLFVQDFCFKIPQLFSNIKTIFLMEYVKMENVNRTFTIWKGW